MRGAKLPERHLRQAVPGFGDGFSVHLGWDSRLEFFEALCLRHSKFLRYGPLRFGAANSRSKRSARKTFKRD